MAFYWRPSIWLIQLKGILFITTNRVGSFDEAFTSRIHVSLHYAELTNQYRETIWDNMINKLEEDRPEVYIDEKVYDYVKTNETLTGLEWNGRQIRNGKIISVSCFATKESLN